MAVYRGSFHADWRTGSLDGTGSASASDRFGDISTAVSVTNQGAFDFIERPSTDDVLLTTVEEPSTLQQSTRRHG